MQREQLSAQRGSQFADIASGAVQNELQRGFTAEQGKLDREYEDTPFADGPREVTDPTTGMTFTATTPREWGILQQQLDIAAKATEREDVQEFTDAQRQAAQQDALDRMQEESRLDISMLSEQEQSQIRLMQQEMENQQTMIDWERAKYEDGMYQTQDGAVFRWSSPETYQAAIDEINQHTQKLAGMASRNPTVWDVYREATDRAKEQLWEPDYVLDEDTGQVVLDWKRTEVDTDTLLENFVAELPMTGMSAQERADATEAFRTYLINAENAPPQDFEVQESGDQTNVTVGGWEQPLVRPDTTGDTPEGVPPSPYTPEAEEVLGESPGLTRAILNLFGLSPREAMPELEQGYYPEGVTPGTRSGLFGRGEGSGPSLEQQLYDQLVALYRRSTDPAEQAAIVEQMQTLVDEEKQEYPDIQSFISRAVGRL
jgi:hypothetical protein